MSSPPAQGFQFHMSAWIHLLLVRPLCPSQCPNVKRFFSSEIACSQTSSPPPALSSTATPMIPWYLCCEPLSTRNTRFQDGRLKNPDLWSSKKTVPPFPHAIGQSIDCLEQLHPSFTTFTWDSIGRHSDSNASCTSPNCNLFPWLHTDCKTVMKPSRVSVGECDSMSRRSGSVKPLMMSRAFARRPDGLLSSGFQVRAQRVSIARSGQRARAWAVSSRDSTLAALVLEQGLLLNFHALQELTFLCR